MLMLEIAKGRGKNVTPEPKLPRRRWTRFNTDIEGYLFIAPAIILIGTFGFFPVFFTVFVSMHKWRIRRSHFLGLENFQELFGGLHLLLIIVAAGVGIYVGWRLLRNRLGPLQSVPAAARTIGALMLLASLAALAWVLPQVWETGDDDMMQALRVTVWYSMGTVPVQLALGLLLAALLDQRFSGRQLFRVVYLLPYIVPAVAAAAVFERLFSLRPESFANQVLLLLGLEPLQWLTEVQGVFRMLFGWGNADGGVVSQYWQSWAQGPSLALVSIMFFNYWVFTGYYALIYSNGLAQIPRQLYEAAEVDGASKLRVFFQIVIPLLSPTTFFLTILGVIGTFKAFNHIYVLRSAAARGAADPMSVYIFFTFFRRSRFGYAAALSLVLFAIVLVLTLVQRRIMERRVFYGE